MYNIPKLLYEEIQKIRKEKKTLSKSLNKMDREYFLFVKKSLFKENEFDKLNKNQKILFKNEDDFQNKKFIFEELDDFYKYRKFFILTGYLFFTKRLFFGKQKLIDNFNLTNWIKESISKSKKLFLGKFIFFNVFSFSVFRFEKKYFEFEISKNITTDSRLGLYIWFDTNFRLGLLNINSFNHLDDLILKKVNFINKDKKSQLNEEIIENIIFYYLLKQHFFSFYTSKLFSHLIVPILNNEKNNMRDLDKFILT